LGANRFEEVNNYSERLTRQFREAGVTLPRKARHVRLR
jgi:hypothetical protein